MTLDDLTAAVEKSNIVTGGGFLLSKTHESLIRIIGRATTLDEVADTVVRAGDPVSITVRQVAEVRYAGPVRRGDASIDTERSIILSVQKQPGADNLELTDEIESTRADIQERLPKDAVISTDIFKQADFIDSAIDNVKEAIRDGVIWVIVVLVVFPLFSLAGLEGRMIAPLGLAYLTMLVAASISWIAWMGGEFLPRFNEGSLTIAAMAPPGVSMRKM